MFPEAARGLLVIPLGPGSETLWMRGATAQGSIWTACGRGQGGVRLLVPGARGSTGAPEPSPGATSTSTRVCVGPAGPYAWPLGFLSPGRRGSACRMAPGPGETPVAPGVDILWVGFRTHSRLEVILQLSWRSGQKIILFGKFAFKWNCG